MTKIHKNLRLDPPAPLPAPPDGRCPRCRGPLCESYADSELVCLHCGELLFLLARPKYEAGLTVAEV